MARKKMIYKRSERRQFDGEIYYASGWSRYKHSITENPKFHQRVIPGYDSSGKIKGYLTYRRKK